MNSKTISISTDRLAHLVLILGIIGITVIVLLSYTFDAEGAMCSKTCQAAKAKGMDLVEYREWLKKQTTRNEGRDGKSVALEDYEDQIESYEDRVKQANFISIRTSKACEISGTCPSYKELADQFDNSNKFLSGDFVFDNETKKWEREQPRAAKVFEFYKFMDLSWVVWVDPDNYTWDRTKQIIIESELRYFDRRDVIENQIRIEYEGLNMDGCKTATIGWTNDGMTILLDVLNHYYSNCKTPLVYDPTIEIFINSTIFADCDRDCFYAKELLQKELKIDQILESERWFDDYCNDDDSSDYSDITSYDRNKDECDRLAIVLDEDVDDGIQTCFGIYCDREEEDEKLTFAKERNKRLKELEDIEKCKKEQIWDEQKYGGTWVRNLYDCTDEDERIEYFEVLLCYEVDVYDEIDCINDDDREEFLDEEVPERIAIKSNSTKSKTKCYGIHCD